MIKIRAEHPTDIDNIRELNKRAFGQDEEGKIVDALRTNGGALLSLVATLDGRIVGQIMYSPVSIDGGIVGAALGPMAVLPEHQNQGIGSKLVEAGNQQMKDAGLAFIVVVGHANYYPRFGFRPASAHGIRCEWEVPDDVFMLLMFNQAMMRDVSGVARYRPEFSGVS
jgi:putative acetyltransferase